MSNTGFKGIDIRQTGSELVFRAFLQNSSGGLVTSGTTNFYLDELQSDGTIKTYDFNNNTFNTGAVTTEALAATYRKSNNGTTDTGLWTATLSTLTAFTVGAIYLLRVNNSGASPTDQMREFQFGSAEGDLTVTANGTGVAELNTDLKMLNGSAAAASNQSAAALAVYQGDVTGGTPSSTSLVDTGLTSADANAYNGRTIVFTGNTTTQLARQMATVSGWTPGTNTLTFTELTRAPAVGDTYVMF